MAKQLTESQIEFIRKNFDSMNNPEIARALGLKLQFLRDRLYELGFYRMRLEYWTDEQIQFLKDNFREIGDLELAEIFQEKWPKQKIWSLKHIEKKRNYLNLHRSPQDLANVMQRNVDQGRMNLRSKGKTNWLSTGPAKEGEIRMYKSCVGVISPRVKIGKCWKWWARWKWEQEFGPIPSGMVVVFKDNDSYNTVPENLELITRSEASSRNVAQAGKKLTDKYIAGMLGRGDPELRKVLPNHPELLNLKRQQLILQRTINDHGKSRTTNN